jgi:hypothetical protein
LTLATLAQQLGVTAGHLLSTAQQLGLPVDTVDSIIDSATDFALRKAMVAGHGPAPQASTPARPPARGFTGGRRPARRRIKESDLSEMAKVVLQAMDADPANRDASEYRPDTFAHAEWSAAEWARFWFEPVEVREWLARHRRISPANAYALKQAGITAAEAAEPMRYNRNVAIAVSCGDLTATEAAAELRARRSVP